MSSQYKQSQVTSAAMPSPVPLAQSTSKRRWIPAQHCCRLQDELSTFTFFKQDKNTGLIGTGLLQFLEWLKNMRRFTWRVLCCAVFRRWSWESSPPPRLTNGTRA